MVTSQENIAETAFPIIEVIMKEKTIDWYSKITQFFVWPIIFVIFNVIFKIEITGRKNLSGIKSPFLIISNHISFYDSFLFRLALGFFTSHLPLRFMAVKKFQWRFLNILASLGIVDLIYALFGVFVIIPGRGVDQNLNEARHIIRAGGNIVMYPEGRITIGAIGKFKIGAAVLARQMNIKILPISLRIVETNSIRKTLTINIGQGVKVDPAQNDEQNTETLYRAVVNLHDNRMN